VIVHTGTQDVIEEYNTGNATIKAQLADAFGGTPTTQPFQYSRVNPVRMLLGAADPTQSHVTNLLHLPFYVNVNLDDPNAKLIAQSNALATFLSSKGANVDYHGVHAGPIHSWNTLDHAAALDWIDNFTLPPNPSQVELWSDAPGDWLQTEVRAQPLDQVARFAITPGVGNALSVTGTQFLDVLAFDVAGFGKSATSLLTLNTQSLDPASDTLVLTNYPAAPTAVMLAGGQPVDAWSYNPQALELTIVPNLTGLAAQVVVIP
jgi:hypothetical protein